MRKTILFMCGCLLTSLLISCEDKAPDPTPPPAPPTPEEPTNPTYYAPPVAHKLSFNVKGEMFNFNYIDSALFIMGSSAESKDNKGPEEYGNPIKPEWAASGRGTEALHTAKLTEYYYMATHEVTNAQFYTIMGYYYIRGAEMKIGSDLTSKWERVTVTAPPAPAVANLPAVFVSWDEAEEFVAKMSKESGERFRLPYEAEWEFACRGVKSIDLITEEKITNYVNKKDPFSFVGAGGSISAIDACYNSRFVYGSDPKKEDPNAVPPTEPKAVGSYKPNGFGLYDMHGNAAEWVFDSYGDYVPAKASWYQLENDNIDYKGKTGEIDRKVYRGGGWETVPAYVRSAARGYSSKRTEYSHQVGFRIAHAPAFRSLGITKIVPRSATIETQCNLIDIKSDEGQFGFVYSSISKEPTLENVSNTVTVRAQKQEDIKPEDYIEGVVQSVVYSDPSFNKNTLRFKIEIALNSKTTYYVRSFHRDNAGKVRYDDVYFFETPPYPSKTLRVNDVVDIDFVLCYPDTVSLGSLPSENMRSIDEKNHWVLFPKYYYISTTEITAEQWYQILSGISAPVGGSYPMAQVSWDDIVNTFLPTLNKLPVKDVSLPLTDPSTIEKFRLPTEAEWEYASRGRIVVGDKDPSFFKPFSNKITGFYDLLPKSQALYDWRRPYDQINPQRILDSETTPIAAGQVKQYSKSASGLYDIHGNVAEWCSDWYGPYPDTKARKNAIKNPKGPTTGTRRIVRGGAYDSPAVECRSAYRSSYKPDTRSSRIGFRLVLEVR